MLTETGSVVAVEDDGLWVETLKLSACGKCQARHGCGQKLLANYNPEMSYIKALYPECGADKRWVLGAQVVIGVDEHALVRATLLAYLVPLLTLIAGLFLGHLAFEHEVSAALGALLGLIAGGVFVRWYGKYLDSGKNACFQARVISSVPTHNF